jgi:hypothetical protein
MSPEFRWPIGQLATTTRQLQSTGTLGRAARLWYFWTGKETSHA